MLRQCLFFGDFEGFYAYKLDAYKKRVYFSLKIAQKLASYLGKIGND